ncbi:MAG: sulfotransferase [Betaproteobacteria bacterium]|nr:sulfotransferase [Betaproteobacteria bacterium]
MSTLPDKDLAPAIARHQKILAAQPGNLAACSNLARLYLDSGKLDEAARLFQRMLRMRPGLAEAVAGLERVAAAYRARGAALKRQKNAAGALSDYRKAIAVDPRGNVNAYIEAGCLLFDQERIPQALGYWRKAAEIQPDSEAAYTNIGVALRKQGRFDDAAAALEKAISVNPKRVEPYLTLAAMYRDLRRMEEAIDTYQRLLAVKPGLPEAVAGVAMAHESKGRIREAWELLPPLVEAGVRTPPVMAAYATVSARQDPPPESAVALLEEQLRRSDLGSGDRRTILRGLGNLCDALNRHEAAFGYFQQLHVLEADAEAQKRGNIGVVARMAATYAPERLARLPRAGNQSELPLFIVGMPRSGTTLTEQILSSHPRVFGAGELTHIGKLATGTLDTELPFPHCLDVLTRDQADRHAQGYLDRLRELSPTADRVIDKMPLNFLHLGLIQVLFPKARVVHCIRHPLDTCLSVYFNDFSKALAFTRDLPTLGAYYREYWKLMQYWKQVLGIPIFDLRYEELVAEPERVSRALVDFCGLEWDDACLRFHESKRMVATPSYHQVRKPVYTRSVGRYKPYEPFLGPLKSALGDLAQEQQ